MYLASCHDPPESRHFSVSLLTTSYSYTGSCVPPTGVRVLFPASMNLELFADKVL